MKILYLLSQRPDSTGSGIYIQAMMQEAKKRGHTPFLVCATNRNDKVPAILSAENLSILHFEKEPLDFSLPGMSDVMPYKSTVFKTLSAPQLKLYLDSFLTKVSEAVTSFSPDLIHTNHLWLLSSQLKNHFPQIPTVVSCHGSDLRQYHQCDHLRETVKRGCKKIDRILALTETQRDEIAEIFSYPKSKIGISGAGYNDTLFRLQEKPASPPLQLLFCGKLSRAKGLPYLLQAIPNVNHPFHLNIVGDGTDPEKAECLQLARENPDRVTIHGSLSQRDLAELMGKCHYFILPSLYEGLPLVVLEALASGCRVITTALPGCMQIKAHFPGDVMNIIPMPQRENVDELSPQEQARFIDHITLTLHNVFSNRPEETGLNAIDIEEQLQPYTWKGVFQRIEEQYSALL